MKLIVYYSTGESHSDLASSVAWTSSDEFISVGDDHVIYRWTTGNLIPSKLHQLPSTLFPTNMDWPSIAKGRMPSKSTRGGEAFVLGSTDGRFYLVNRNGKLDKGVEAHQGATLSIKWSPRGNEFATAGEDGQVKIWSQSGMLRSIVVQCNQPIYSLAWGSTSTQLVFSLGKQLVLQPLQANAKPISWKAHEGLVLQVDWCHVNDRIISGSEDCRYKIWDSYGRLLYSSTMFQSPITSLAWSPDGSICAVGGFNTLHLCDKTGWLYVSQKVKTGSLMCIRWSPDGTRLAAAGGNGQVITAQVIEQRKEWNGFEAAIVDDRNVNVHNLRNGAVENLEFRDRVAKLSLSYDHLIVATVSQCYTYKTNNFNTPVITDSREGNITSIVQCAKYFALVDGAGIYVYTYDGRLSCSIKDSKIQTESLLVRSISICNDALALKNQTDEKSVYLFDVTSGKPLADGRPIIHSTDITAIRLDQCGPASDRRLVVLDSNKDLFLISVRSIGTERKTAKLGSMVTSFTWADETNILAAIMNDNLTVWYYPNVAFVDADLQRMTTEEYDIQDEYGKQAELIGFVQNRIYIRKANGSTGSLSIPAYFGGLQKLTASAKWTEALALCHSVKENKLWACLAGFALNAKNLDTAEIAFSQIEEVDKVEYIRHIKSFSSKERRTAELLLLLGEQKDAESMLIQSGLYFTAILIHLHHYNWERAMELAKKYGVALDIVLSMRAAYLQQMKRTENLEIYMSQTKQQILNPKVLQERIEQELKQEKAKCN